jgi:hypothetical protein
MPETDTRPPAITRPHFPTLGGFYRHYKGQVYMILSLSWSVGLGNAGWLVTYLQVGTGLVFTQPHSRFMESWPDPNGTPLCGVGERRTYRFTSVEPPRLEPEVPELEGL